MGRDAVLLQNEGKPPCRGRDAPGVDRRRLRSQASVLTALGTISEKMLVILT